MEARPLSSEVLTRRCVVTKLSELTIERFRGAVESGAGGFLILLPRNFMNLTQEHLEVHITYKTVSSNILYVQ